MAENMSHRALSMADILEQIAEYTNVLDRATLLRCALVAREWQDPFLAHLWRNHASFHHLYQLVGPVYFSGSEVNYAPLQGSVSDAQLAVWKKYAPWLAYFTVPDHTYSFKSVLATLETLSRSQRNKVTGDLLPAVDEVELTGGFDTQFQEAVLQLLNFLPRTLKRVNFKSDFDGNEFVPIFMSHATTHFPYLESLKLMGDHDEGELQIEWGTISEHLKSLTRLKEVVVPMYFVPGEFLYHLGLLTSLETLDFTSANECNTEDELQLMRVSVETAARFKSEKIAPFPRLRVLLGACIPANNPQDCFRKLAGANLVRLFLLISLSEKERASVYRKIDHLSLYDVLSTLKKLENLELEFCHHPDLPDGAQHTALKSLPTSQISGLVQLRVLRISHPWAFGFGGEHIVTASKCWPKLKLLELRDFYSKIQDVLYDLWQEPKRNRRAKPECGPEILRDLLANLFELETLAIDFSPWRDADKILDTTVIPCSLKVLELGEMATFNACGENERLIQYLSSILPQTRLVNEKFSLSATREESSDESEDDATED
jgi:hypothetical protein